jgi:hypothetical protein
LIASDILFDCPPAFTDAGVFIKWLVEHSLEVDLWIIPIESRTNMMGAEFLISRIRKSFPSPRLVLVMNNCPGSSVTERDRAEAAKFPNVELYSQIIPRHSMGFRAFDQGGGSLFGIIIRVIRCLFVCVVFVIG